MDRSKALKAQDPAAAVIGSAVIVAAQLGLFEAIGLDAAGVASLLGGLLATAAMIRRSMEKRRDRDLAEVRDNITRERVTRQGIPEGGKLEMGDSTEDLPIPDPPDLDRVQRRG